MDIKIEQGAVKRILIPVTDANGDPVDLTKIPGICWTYGRRKGYPGDLLKKPGDPGCEIVTDKTDHPEAENNALQVMLTAEETRIAAGNIYYHAAWAMSIDGPIQIVYGMMEIEATVWCE
jgi:hypothetical protein